MRPTKKKSVKKPTSPERKPPVPTPLPKIGREEVEHILKVENHMCFSLYAASRLMVQAYAPMLAELQLTYPQYLALLPLWEHDGLTVKEIGELLYLDSGTLTPVLTKLEETGYIERKRSPSDERRVQNFLTKKARDLKIRIGTVPISLFCKTGMSVDAAANLKKALRDLLDRLDQI